MSIPYRPDLRIREIRTSSGRVIDHVIEVEDAGEIERIRDHLEPAEYDAALELRRLWHSGTINGRSGITPIARLASGFASGGMSDGRLTRNDALRKALGYCGMMAGYVLDVVVYDRRVETKADMAWLREGLQRLVKYGIDVRTLKVLDNRHGAECVRALP
jgi:hypothetical protein